MICAICVFHPWVLYHCTANVHLQPGARPIEQECKTSVILALQVVWRHIYDIGPTGFDSRQSSIMAASPSRVVHPFSSVAPEAKGPCYDVFICHAAADIVPGRSGKKFASSLAVFLGCMGLTPWLDRLCIETGTSNVEAIMSGLANSQVLLPIITNSFFESNWTQKETVTGVVWGLPVLPAFHHTVDFDCIKDRGHVVQDPKFDEKYRGQPLGRFLTDIAGVSNVKRAGEFAR